MNVKSDCAPDQGTTGTPVGKKNDWSTIGDFRKSNLRELARKIFVDTALVRNKLGNLVHDAAVSNDVC